MPANSGNYVIRTLDPVRGAVTVIPMTEYKMINVRLPVAMYEEYKKLAVQSERAVAAHVRVAMAEQLKRNRPSVDWGHSGTDD